MSDRTVADPRQPTPISKPTAAMLICLRLAIGWQFLYEGLVKLMTPNWSAASYLLLSHGIWAGFFHWLGSSPSLVRAVDLMNIWGLILIGMALVLGAVTRLASASGILLLGLYYMAQPPLIRADYLVPVEGHYLFVDKNLIELLILTLFLVLPAGSLWGLGRMWRDWRWRRRSGCSAVSPGAARGPWTRRRTLENLIGAPVLGLLGYAVGKKYDWEKVHAVTGATLKLRDLSLSDLKGELPKGTLGKLKISRLILGGNLIGGWAHSRDLIYGPQLFKAYNTDRKVFETLELAERAGINTFLADVMEMPLFARYRQLTGSKMQTICQVFPTANDLTTSIDKAIDYGASTPYIQGAHADLFVKNGQIALLGKALDHIKSQGYLGGIGAHSILVPMASEQAGLDPDYYVKTLHSDQYWSATPRKDRFEYMIIGEMGPGRNQWHDNMFDLFPEKTVAFMATVKKPWVAFKVLAAGAFLPKDGFKFAFENGADFIAVGMFDFQLVEDINTALALLSNLQGRTRPWYA